MVEKKHLKDVSSYLKKPAWTDNPDACRADHLSFARYLLL